MLLWRLFNLPPMVLRSFFDSLYTPNTCIVFCRELFRLFLGEVAVAGVGLKVFVFPLCQYQTTALLDLASLVDLLPVSDPGWS